MARFAMLSWFSGNELPGLFLSVGYEDVLCVYYLTCYCTGLGSIDGNKWFNVGSDAGDECRALLYAGSRVY